jgi:hypothetical protein
VRSYFQDNQCRKNWRHGSSSRVPDSKKEALSSDPRTSKKKKERKEKKKMETGSSH